MARILLVCTGNICRSPIAEGLLRRMLVDRGIEGVDVESAGVSGLDGHPPVPEAVGALGDRGIDISGHLARRLEPQMVESTDLVVAMAASHRESVRRLVPGATDRTFTLKELAHLLDQQDEMWGRPADGGRMEAAISAARDLRDEGGASDLADENVPDPLGLGLQAYEAVAWEIEGLTGRLVEGLFGPTSRPDS